MLNDEGKFIVTENSLSFACAIGSDFIVTELLNSKVMFTAADSAKFDISELQIDTVKLLNTAGMPLTYKQFIDMCIEFKKKPTTKDINRIKESLSTWGFTADDNLYLEFHKRHLIEGYKGYGTLFPEQTVKFRKEFMSSLIKEDLIELIEKYKMIPDQFCYDNLIHHACDDRDSLQVFDYLEKEYGMKPTLLTIAHFFEQSSTRINVTFNVDKYIQNTRSDGKLPYHPNGYTEYYTKNPYETVFKEKHPELFEIKLAQNTVTSSSVVEQTEPVSDSTNIEPVTVIEDTTNDFNELDKALKMTKKDTTKSVKKKKTLTLKKKKAPVAAKTG
jgi:hypothetical protein